MTEQCNRCRFWLLAEDGAPDTEDQQPYGWGWCRRSPPQLSERMSGMLIPSLGNTPGNYDPENVATVSRVSDCSLFPATWHDKWCGEYEAAAGSLLSVLAERNTLIDHIGTARLADADADEQCGLLNALDNRIMETPAASKDDVFAKLLLVAQLRVEGHDTAEASAAAVVGEAQAIAGIGRVSPNVTTRGQ